MRCAITAGSWRTSKAFLLSFRPGEASAGAHCIGDIIVPFGAIKIQELSAGGSRQAIHRDGSDRSRRTTVMPVLIVIAIVVANATSAAETLLRWQRLRWVVVVAGPLSVSC